MERLTIRTTEGDDIVNVDTSALLCTLNADEEGRVLDAIERLAEYEDIFFAPDGTEIITLDELRNIVAAKRDERCLVLPVMPQDVNDVLEPLKLQSALNSELLKLEFRKVNRPKDVSILDYTIIYALDKCLREAALKGEDGCK